MLKSIHTSKHHRGPACVADSCQFDILARVNEPHPAGGRFPRSEGESEVQKGSKRNWAIFYKLKSETFT